MTKGVAALRRQLTLVPAVEFLPHMPAAWGLIPPGICRLTDETQRQRINSNGYPPIFVVQLFNEAVASPAGWNRKPEIPDGRRRTVSTYISAPRWDTRQNSNGYIHIFGIQLFNGAVANTAGWNRELEIKDGGHRTGSTSNSADRSDRDEIP